MGMDAQATGVGAALRSGSPESRGETAAVLRWERITYWPLTICALLFLITYTVQVIGDAQGIWRSITGTFILLMWFVFGADYVVRLVLSKPKRRWFRTHLFDLAVVFIPTLRPVRLLGAFTRIASFSRSAGSSLRARLLIYGAGSALLLIWQISLFVLESERYAPGANIHSFGDAIWWAFCTVTTVGYGDFVPVTVQGRVFAVVLMLGGVVLVGLIVASFSSWVVERATRGHEDQLPATQADVHRLLDAIERRDAGPRDPGA